MTFTQTMLSFQGRLRRRDLWVCWVGLTLTYATLFVLFERLDGVDLTPHRVWLIPLLMTWPTYALLAKRMHDRNRSAWWALLLLVPDLLGSLDAIVGLPEAIATPSQIVGGMVAIWFFIDFGLLDGTPGDNRFGPSPKAPREPSPSETPAVA
ncbi:uncharacterized membrane protein YhaH (DUF805 family) [Caulobacter sp. BE264]|uniref:DUF805 domain-containing protein n=1 Tax=Caulobacter sp. BE264 TaxID=2817724 RepID=UPI00285E2402|nr:DUF805 domain-containing protein [Caulobacter sp. BE264]MDR7229941.1 uncharacterized membrane protein YhaH (DUF805 family) [Caulobacter sp. BE264]